MGDISMDFLAGSIDFVNAIDNYKKGDIIL